tara:strand:+ start:454 stop:1692 length:1239 start_codon:yes stop_codon:yes gene_type:complete
MFNDINNRVFYACMGIIFKGRNINFDNDSPTAGEFLTGVQNVGLDGDLPSVSLPDIGRFQKKYHYYSPQSFSVTIDRIIDQNSNFFYHVLDTEYLTYESSHVLAPHNIGMTGTSDGDEKSLRNYDITILVGSDQFKHLGSGSGGDADKVLAATLKQCLVTSINYSISADKITESITLTSKELEYDASYSLEDFVGDANLPQSANILKREDFDFLNSSRNSVLPYEVEQMFNAKNSADQESSERNQRILGLQSIDIQATIDYSTLYDSDFDFKSGPSNTSYDKYRNIWTSVVLPVQVTCSFTGIARQLYPFSILNNDTRFSQAEGDGERVATDWNKVDREIKLVAEKFPNPPSAQYFIWDLGKSNYLTAISQSGGDTDGGLAEFTLSYQNDASDFVPVKDTQVRIFDKPTSPF